ncbi:MAG: hypothetical protein LUF33_00420, partial [Clostridiales bacterium]|nr:hypothetical protein [Clostridiales bacterium]
RKIKKPLSVLLAVIMLLSTFSVVPFTVSAEAEYGITLLLGTYNISTKTDGSMYATINGDERYYSDEFDPGDISTELPKLENQNVIYELHDSVIVAVYTMKDVLNTKVSVEFGSSVSDGVVYSNGKFSQSSFDLTVKLTTSLNSYFEDNSLLWFLSGQEDSLYTTLKSLYIEPSSNGVDFGSTGYWFWKDYQTNISEDVNQNIKVNETVEYTYTVNLQDSAALNQSEYNVEFYVTPTFDYGTETRQTAKLKIGNLDYQQELTQQKKAASNSGTTTATAATTLSGLSSAIQFSKSLFSSSQTQDINNFANIWMSELILARYLDESDLKENMSSSACEEVANKYLEKIRIRYFLSFNSRTNQSHNIS